MRSCHEHFSSASMTDVLLPPSYVLMLKSLELVPSLICVDILFSYILADKTHAMVAVLSMDHHATLNTLDWLYDTPGGTKQ